MEVPVPVKLSHTSQRSETPDNRLFEAFSIYNYVIDCFKPISFRYDKNLQFTCGKSLNTYLDDLSLNCWQNKIRYHRARKHISAEYMAEQLNMKNKTEYQKKYENPCHKYYTTIENIQQICDILGVRYEDIADDYLLFLTSGYGAKLRKAVKLSGLTCLDFAKKYQINYATMSSAFKEKYKLSYENYERYKKIFEEFNL